MKKLFLTIFAIVFFALNSMGQSDSTMVYRDGLLIYPSGRAVTVEAYMKWVDSLPDPAVRIRKKEMVLELMKSK